METQVTRETDLIGCIFPFIVKTIAVCYGVNNSRSYPWITHSVTSGCLCGLQFASLINCGFENFDE